jgi:hyperosmotically inducible periplasmic protein
MRALATLVLLVVVGGFGYYMGYRAGSGHAPDFSPAHLLGRDEVGTTGSRPATDGARDQARAIGDKLAVAGSQATEFLSDAALTTKIKSKIGLDDTLDSAAIHVSTTDSVVTLAGTVKAAQERQRAMQLARETKGVKSVVDRLRVGR